jgi:hypothetical protein
VAAAEQEAAADYIQLRAELLVRQQHEELRAHQSPPSTWSSTHLTPYRAWVQTLREQHAEELSELATEVETRRQLVASFANSLGFRKHADLISALGLDTQDPHGAANEP